MRTNASASVAPVVLPAFSSRISNIGGSSTEIQSESKDGSSWAGSVPSHPGLDAMVQNIPLVIDSGGVLMPAVATESSQVVDESAMVRLSGVVPCLDGDMATDQSALISVIPPVLHSVPPSALQTLKCERNAGIIQALLRQAAAERLVLSQGQGGLSGESSPLLDLADPIDSNSVDRVAVAQLGSLAPGLVTPVVVQRTGVV